MKHTIDYGKSALSETEQRKKAVKDIREYVGNSKFKEINTILTEYVKANPDLTAEQFSMALFLFPVSGYPILAWYETIKANIK